jgi:4-hydroxybenzoate polyprenyltransferase
VRWPAWLGLMAFGVHLASQIVRLKIDDPELCKRLFYSNKYAGLLLFAGLLADAVLRAA